MQAPPHTIVCLLLSLWAAPSFQFNLPKFPNPTDIIPDAAGSIIDDVIDFTSIVQFETRYYTDYYFGGRKLFREVVNKATKERVACSYAGDRGLVGAVIRAPDANITGILQKLIPKIPLDPVNITTEEIDTFIDECINLPPKKEPFGLKAFLKKLAFAFGELGNHLFIFPGTKWCGAGDVARDYNDLGSQEETDRCCRDHDHAMEDIPRGKTLYGLENPLPYTITGCAHDWKFEQCLANNEIVHSSAVGMMFFNILKTQCFDKRKLATCVKKIPFIPCVEYKYDENSEETWQIFDPKMYMSKNAPSVFQLLDKMAFYTPGIDNIIHLFS